MLVKFKFTNNNVGSDKFLSLASITLHFFPTFSTFGHKTHIVKNSHANVKKKRYSVKFKTEDLISQFRALNHNNLKKLFHLNKNLSPS